MTDDLQALEATLAGLRPVALDQRLLARLEACTAGETTVLNSAEAQFEASLRNNQPAALSPALLAALEATLTSSAATEASRIIPFPQQIAADRRRSQHPMLAAVAAVALFGAAAAWFLPDAGTHLTASAPVSKQSPASPFATPPAASATPVAPTAPTTPAAQVAQAAPATQNFVPAAFNTGLSQASDVGVLWQSQNQAQRVVKVVYWDRVTLVNPEGKQIECENPRVEYILVPEKID